MTGPCPLYEPFLAARSRGWLRGSCVPAATDTDWQAMGWQIGLSHSRGQRSPYTQSLGFSRRVLQRMLLGNQTTLRTPAQCGEPVAFGRRAPGRRCHQVQESTQRTRYRSSLQPIFPARCPIREVPISDGSGQGPDCREVEAVDQATPTDRFPEIDSPAARTAARRPAKAKPQCADGRNRPGHIASGVDADPVHVASTAYQDDDGDHNAPQENTPGSERLRTQDHAGAGEHPGEESHDREQPVAP
jgi:hypothetical protein